MTNQRELDEWFRALCTAARLKPVRDADRTLHVIGRHGDIFPIRPGRLAWGLWGAPTPHRKQVLIRNHVPGLLRLHQEGCERPGQRCRRGASIPERRFGVDNVVVACALDVTERPAPGWPDGYHLTSGPARRDAAITVARRGVCTSSSSNAFRR